VLPKIKKVWQIRLLALLLITLLFNWLLDPNRYKPELQSLLQQQLKHAVSIGNIEYSLFSPSTLALEKFVVGELQEPLLSLGSLQVQVRLWSLIWREVEIEKLVLDGLKINASPSDLDGLKTAQEVPGGSPPKAEKLAIKSLLIKEFAIEHIDIHWHAKGQQIQIQQAEVLLRQMQLVRNWQLLGLASSFTLNAKSQRLGYNNLQLDKFSINAKSAQQTFELTKLQTEMMSGQISASAKVDVAHDFSTSLILAVDGVDINLTPDWLQEFAPKTGQAKVTKSNSVNNKLPIQSLLLSEIEIKDSRVRSSLSSELVSLDKIQLKLQDIQLVDEYQLARTQSDLAGSFAANVHALTWGKYQLDTLQLRGQRQQLLDISKLAIMAPGINLQVSGQADLSKPELPVSISSSNAELNFNDFHQDWFVDNLPRPEGSLSADIQLALALLAPQPLTSLTSELTLRSRDMQLHRLNLNGILAGLQQTEKTSLLDVGSFLATGPLGLIASQVANLGETGLTARDGVSLIKQLEIDVAVDKGVLSTRDVALSTDKYRVALDGKVDLVQKQLEQVKFYILDEKGCADIQQTLNGPMDSPDGIFSQAVSTTVLKPFSNILSQAGSLLTKCQPVYQGLVVAPQG